MQRIRPHVKRFWRVVAIVLYVGLSPLWGPAAEGAFHLTPATPGFKGIAAIDVTGLVTAPRDTLPDSFGQPKPRPPTRVAPQSVGTHANGSTNRFVSPWGCEARHAQQWSSSGRYWGKYQFDRQTYAAHGGNPNDYGHASEAEQDRVASRVQYDAWPNC